MSIATTRLNAYRIMWTLVMYDLPTETKKNARRPPNSEKIYYEIGLTCFNLACILGTAPAAKTHMYIKTVLLKSLPAQGKIGILQITDKQFGEMEIFYGKKEQKLPEVSQQLELF
jgi:CRISPR-associated protein Cas2